MKSSQHAPQENPFPVRLASPAQRALAAAGYTHLEQLTTVTEADLKKLHGMGPNAIAQLREALAARGLSFSAGSGGDQGQD
ncbi:MAG TPA: DNA-binding protein [Chloroflexia bacterium]|nr:DNA-binding protein [Chloroflexia bacterium]